MAAHRPEAKRTKVPWIIQDAFPGYHGVAWYWREFVAPANSRPGGRYLLRFWAVDYLAEVWLNGICLGKHEGPESPFVLDATPAIRPRAANRLAVRVLNPTHEPIDGIVLSQVPHRNKALPYRSGSAWNQGGIWDSVELLLVPAVRIEDVFARPDAHTGRVRIQARLASAAPKAVPATVEFVLAPAASSSTPSEFGKTWEATPRPNDCSATCSAMPRTTWKNRPYHCPPTSIAAVGRNSSPKGLHYGTTRERPTWGGTWPR